MLETENLKYIPNELKFDGKWCAWRLTNAGKEPFNVKTGYHAKTNDINTFCSYGELLHHYGEYDGIAIGIFNNFSAIDIDHCIDDNGTISQMALDIIEFCNSYTEKSPSGHGIRIIFKTKEGFKFNKEKYYIKNSNLGLEVYTYGNTNRFVTITGNSIHKSDDIKEVDLEYILSKYMLRDNSWSSILKNDQKLNELWFGRAPGSGANESELDLALCSKLAYYFNNDEYKIREMFEKSPYFMSKDEKHKAKWLREDYSAATIKHSLKTKETFAISNSVNELLECTDTGNALYFVDIFKDKVRFNKDNECWMIWNGKYWQNDYQENIRNYVTILAEELLTQLKYITNENERKTKYANIKHILNKGGKDSLLTEAASLKGMPVVNDDFDKNEFYLNCDNGVVNLKTGQLLEHSKEQMISMSTHCDVDLSGNCPTFKKFISDTMEGKKDVIDYVLKTLGYALTGTAIEQEMYIFYGDGSNGKSLLLEVIHDILGDYAIVSRPSLLTEEFNGNTSMGQIARLKGKRFVCVEELKDGNRFDESVIKSLTSGIGDITGRFLYANEFEFKFKGKIFMATNYRPPVKGQDKGIWRRINVVPFNKSFEGANNDKYLKDKLLAERAQILGLLVQYCIKYQVEGLEPPESIKAETNEYKEESDMIQTWIKECCELSPEYISKASELYNHFYTWCRNNNEIRIMSSTMFGKNMKRKFERKQLSFGKVYYGIKISDNGYKQNREMQFESIKVNSDI